MKKLFVLSTITYLVAINDKVLEGRQIEDNINQTRVKRQYGWTWTYIDIIDDFVQSDVQEDDDRWIWDYVDAVDSKAGESPKTVNDINEPTHDTTSTLPVEPEKVEDEENPTITKKVKEENPCDLPPSPMPDFSAPGRRISEQKCYEYMWNIKSREESSFNHEACEKYKKDRGIMSFFTIGGRSALPGEFPHMGAIGWKAAQGTWIFKCGSSLISSRFALTAAHCSKVSSRDTAIADFEPKIIRFGDKNIIDQFANGISPIDADISRIIAHPQYQSPKKYFDIALIELVSAMFFNYNVQPACLWTSFDTNSLGSRATLTGWGVVETAGRQISPTLQAAEVEIIDSETCDELLRPNCNRLWCGISETQICAGNLTGGVDACQGDSGGPLQVKIPLPPSTEGAMHFVIGIISFGVGCARENTPGVYTRVSSFVDWIESIVWA